MKLLMVRSHLLANENIKMILSGIGAPEEMGAPEDYQIDDHPVGAKVVTPMQADSSQMSAIVDVLQDKSLIIEGPPGTGKSQTIANLIALNLQAGKKVLFVAEKPAALEVVARRLESIGLGHYSLYMHSTKTKPITVYEKLNERIRIKPTEDSNFDRINNSLNRHRRTIDTYLDSIHKRRKPLNKTLHEMIWSLNECISRGGIPEVLRNEEKVADSQHHESRLDLFNELALAVESANPDGLKPWHWIDASSYTSTARHDLEDNCTRIHNHIERVNQLVSELSSDVGIPQIDAFMTGDEAPRVLAEMIKGLIDEERLSTFIGKTNAKDIETVIGLTSDIANANGPAFALKVEVAKDAIDKISDMGDVNLPTNLSTGDTIYQISESHRATKEIQNIISNDLSTYADWYSRTPLDIFKLSRCLDLFETLAGCGIKNLAPEMLHPRKIAEWEKHVEQASSLHDERARLSEVYEPMLLPSVEDLMRLQITASEMEQKWFKFLNSEWRALKKEVRKFRSTQGENRAALTKAGLESAIAYMRNKDKWSEAKVFSTSSFEADHTSRDDIEMKGKIGPALHELKDLDKKTSFQITRIFDQYAKAPYAIDTDVIRAKLEDWLEVQKKPGCIALHGHVERESLVEIRWGVILELDDSMSKVAASLEAVVEDTTTYGSMDVIPTLEDCHAAVAESHLDKILREQGCTLDEIDSAPHKHLDWIRKASSLSNFISTSEDLPGSIKGAMTTGRVIELSNHLIEKVPQIHDGRHQAAELMDRSLSMLGKYEQCESERFQKASDLCQVVFEHIGSLPTWSRLCKIRERALQLGIKKWIYPVVTNDIGLEIARAGYEASVFNDHITQIYSNEEQLNSITGDQLSSARSEFKNLDTKLRSIGCAKIANDCHLPTSEITQGSPGPRVRDKSELHLINNEIGKSRRHLKLRPLFARANSALLELQPCMMLNPTTVAEVLPKECDLFDLVIFDEASQVKPGDALGSIARARQFVVVGDPKQLPPTSFFSSTINPDDIDPDDQLASADSESILEVAQKSMPPKRYRRLKMHYRSEHESLIAFSNKYFYDNELVIFPAPSKADGRLGIDFVHVPNGEFSKSNRIEAVVVAQAIVGHATKYESMGEDMPSIGVAAMNKDQAVLIWDVLESLCQKDQRTRNLIRMLDTHREPLFIKNLENVQGDERDNIFISLTYGPPPGATSVPQRFGPINSSGGWRRLNVLITRARRHVRVFSSMLENDISGGPEMKGRNALRNYIEYARTGQLHEAGTLTGREPDSDFEISVATVLSNMGLEAVPQVGVAGYFIDIGVRKPGSSNFFMGIECDGATYHSSRSARERDAIRQNVIESKGWVLHRIWSTDWYSNREHSIEILREAIKRQLNTLSQ